MFHSVFTRNFFFLFILLSAILIASPSAFAAENIETAVTAESSLSTDAGDLFNSGVGRMQSSFDEVKNGISVPSDGGFTSFLSFFWVDCVPDSLKVLFSLLLLGMAIIAVVRSLAG